MSDAPKKARRPKLPKPPLSAQHVRFARLLFDRGATGKTVPQCYLEAGFPPKATPHATEMAAHRCVRNREFLRFYRDLQSRAADAAQVDANMVLQGLTRIAFSRLPDLYDERGRIKLPHEWPAGLVQAVEGVESEELFEQVSSSDPETKKTARRKELTGYVRKVKVARKTDALRLLAQILRMVGPDAGAGAAAHAPLVIGGEANPDAL